MIKENYPSRILEEAVDAIKSLPGIGSHNALRLALYLLRQPKENVSHFTSAINNLRNDVKYCRSCMMISDTDECSICADKTRNRNTICVVESIRDVMSIENTSQYHGLYHVLKGIISPLNGIGPSDITINELVERVKILVETSNVASDIEVILALSGDVEGDTTSLYIYKLLSPLGIKVSTLARGLGFGDNLEYADELTLGRSILNRQVFKP